MNEEAYKAFTKLRVIIFAVLVYIPAIFILSWFAWYIIQQLGITSPLFWQWKWWQMLLFFITQYVYFTVMYGMVKGVVAVIVRNKDFFLK